MRRPSAPSRRLASALVACALAGPAAAEQKNAALDSVAAISPIFGQLVMLSYPKPFRVVFENAGPASYIREAVPAGETVESWRQMITVTGAKGLALKPGATPDGMAGSIAGGFERACPKTFAATGLGAIKIGDADAYVALASCGTVKTGDTARSETAMIVAVKGTSDMYTIQWAERGAPSATPLAPDGAVWAGRLKQLAPIRLCPIVAGERAPYPSCVSQK